MTERPAAGIKIGNDHRAGEGLRLFARNAPEELTQQFLVRRGYSAVLGRLDDFSAYTSLSDSSTPTHELRQKFQTKLFFNNYVHNYDSRICLSLSVIVLRRDIYGFPLLKLSVATDATTTISLDHERFFWLCLSPSEIDSTKRYDRML